MFEHRAAIRRPLLPMVLSAFALVALWPPGGAALAAGSGEPATAGDPPQAPKPRTGGKAATGHTLDRSGRERTGKASFYAKRFNGRTMADGTPMDPKDDNAASKTLPLGTTAKVTNVETGKSAVVTIQDRGPYVDGRIVDLSPSTAREIGITPKNGVADVKVEPIAVPMPDGSVKPGAAASEKKSGGWLEWLRGGG